MFIDTKQLVAAGYAAALDALAQEWPLTAFEAVDRPNDDLVRISWVDGPARSEVRDLLGPLLTLTGSLRAGGEELQVRESMLEVYRQLSPLVQACSVGRLICEGALPPLPDPEVYARAGVDPLLPGPYPLGVVNDLALQLPFYSNGSPDPVSLLVVRAEELLSCTSLVDTRALLGPLGASGASVVECFGRLCVDLGLSDAEDAALYAASGGWDLAERMLVT